MAESYPRPKGSLTTLLLTTMPKTPQISMSDAQVEQVSEKLAELLCNLLRNHPELLAEYVKQPHTHKRPK